MLIAGAILCDPGSLVGAQGDPGAGDDQGLSRRERIARSRSLYREGVAAYQADDLEEALRKMKAAHRLFRQPELAYNVARVCERMGEARHAMSWYLVYLEHGSPDAETRAQVEASMRDLEGLMDRQRDQVFAAPPSRDELTAEARTFFERGVAMYRRQQYRAAMVAFTAAHQYAPFAALLYNMALTSERLEQWRDAIDYYREYLRLQPNAGDRNVIDRRIAELRARRH